jgi:hypothetical protein
MGDPKEWSVLPFLITFARSNIYWQTNGKELRSNILKRYCNTYREKTFGQSRDEVIGGCIKPHNEELHNFYYPSNKIRIIKSRKMRWAGYVACMGEYEWQVGFWCESQGKRDHYGA